MKRFFLKLVVCLFGCMVTGGLGAQDIAYTSCPNFAYDFPTAVVYNDQPTFRLDPQVEKLATVFNRYLGQSMFFNSEFLSNVKSVRKYHVKNKPNKANIGKIYNVMTVDNVMLSCTYFDRGSKSLMLVGGGFTNERELMSPFIDMFPDYDIVLFDFRGHGFNPSKIELNPIRKGFGIDPEHVRFGVVEHRDVLAVVEWFRRIKKHHCKGVGYDNVYGLGVCYSAFVFTKAAAIAEQLTTNPAIKREFSYYREIAEHGLFTKLILDGCWLSLPLFVDKIMADILTLTTPQTGGWAKHWFWGSNFAKRSLDFVATNIVGLQHHADVCLLDYVQALKSTPLLFFHCKDDYMIRRHEFETLYNAIPCKEKTVILTNNTHVRNHLKQKELYKLCSDLFLQLPQPEFIACLQNPKKIINYSARQFVQACRDVGAFSHDMRHDELVWPLMMSDEHVSTSAPEA